MQGVDLAGLFLAGDHAGSVGVAHVAGAEARSLGSGFSHVRLLAVGGELASLAVADLALSGVGHPAALGVVIDHALGGHSGVAGLGRAEETL
jgi:hypothetical protein